MRDAAMAVSGVVEVSVYDQPAVSTIGSSGSSDLRFASIQGLDPDHLPLAFRDAEFLTPLNLTRGSIALTTYVAGALGVGAGDQVFLHYERYDPPTNTTLVSRLNLTVTTLFTMPPNPAEAYLPPGYFEQFALVHVQDVRWIEEQLGIPRAYSSGIVGEVWIDRARLVDPYDIPGSQRRLGRLVRQLEDALAGFEAQVHDQLSFALLQYSETVNVQRLLFLFLSVPILLLGFYLGAVGVDLGHAERRREFAVLKSRGAGSRQLVSVLLLEAALGGLVATALGLAVGVPLSRLLLGYVSPFPQAAAPEYERIALSPETIVLVATMSILLMAAVSYRSARRTARLPIVETLRYYAPGETKIHYRPVADIVLVTLGVVTYAGGWYVRADPGSFVAFLAGPIFIILLPLAPVFLIIGTTRLLTRSTGKTYEFTSRACKPFAKDLSYVVKRNLLRNPRRSANVAVIIALGLAFGIFIFSLVGSQQAYRVRALRASIGADITLSSPDLNPSEVLANLTGIPEVAAATRVLFFGAQGTLDFSTVYALDPDPFLAVTQPESWYFDGLSPEGAAAVLRTPGNVLVTKALVDRYFLAVGDSIHLQVFPFNRTTGMTETRDLTVTVGGIVRGLPGSTFGGELPAAVYGTFGTLAPLLPPAGSGMTILETERYYVDVRAGADWRAAKSAIVALGSYDLRVFEEERELINEDPVFQAYFGFMNTEIAFMVLILTAGLGLVLYAASLEREVEFAGIIARGAGGWQTAEILVGEALSIMIVGFVVGAGIGLLSGMLTVPLFFGALIAGSEPLVPLMFEFPLEGLFLLAAAPVAMVVTALLVSLRIARMNVAKVLKMRGG